MIEDVIDPEITELLGPPRAYFEVHASEGMAIRIVYRTIVLFGSTVEDVTKLYHERMAMLRARLKEHPVSNRIIWWRRKPDINLDFELRMTRIFFRLETTPILPEAVWDEIFGDLRDNDRRHCHV